MTMIVWRCDRCKWPIRNGQGWLTISYGDMRKYRRARKRWKEKNPGPFIEGTALMRMPGCARWCAWHKRCDRTMDHSCYTVRIEEVRTERQLLEWTAQLIGKTWFADTDWEQVIWKALRENRKEAAA
jgi:hypothetical protein